MYNDIQNGTSGENIKNKTKRWQYAYAFVRFQRPELIPDIEIFLLVSIFKIAATIPQKFNIVRFQGSF
jgi:hypothetical protein